MQATVLKKDAPEESGAETPGRTRPSGVVMNVSANRRRWAGLAVAMLIALIVMLVAAPAFAASSDFSQAINFTNGTLGQVSWINGDINANNSRYYEGMSVPQRLVLYKVPTTPNNQHVLTFTYTTTKAGKHAFDFITSYDQSLIVADKYGVGFGDATSTATLADEMISASGARVVRDLLSGGYANGLNKTDVSVEPDTHTGFDVQSRQTKYDNVFGGTGSIRMYGDQAITNATVALNHTGSETGDSEVTVTLRWRSASTKLLLLWGGHLAVSGDSSKDAMAWGTTAGAHFVSGGPYHFHLVGMDGSPLGGQDNNIKAGAVMIRNGSISGYKWKDLDADGAWDGRGQAGGEPGLNGWTIYLDTIPNGQYDTGEPFTVTANDPATGQPGYYSFTNVAPDSYVVREVSPPDWTCSYPGLGYWPITIGSADDVSEVNFGNWEDARVTGYKWHDTDADGTWDDRWTDAAEPGRPDWTIEALQGTTVVDSTTTGSDGSYTLNLAPGTYTIQEVAQNGWTQSYPSNPTTYSVTVTAGGVTTERNFGNYTTGTVTGHKWHDLDGDGTWDGKGTALAEPGLARWTIEAVQGTAVAASTETAADGSYTLTLAPGTYTIREVLTDGWTQSAPVGGTYSVTVKSQDEIADKDFGNFTEGGLGGHKFHDENANGTWDGKGTPDGEPGLNGWKIEAVQAGSVVASTTTYADATNGDGYWYLDLDPGTYTIREVLQDGWTQSAPAASTYSVTIVSDQDIADKDFGNYTTGTITGNKWHDLDGDGVWDGKGTADAEPILSGWTIQAVQGDTVVGSTDTVADGSYALHLAPGVYAIREVLQDGWTQSAPAPVHTYSVNLTSQATESDVDFGNYTSGTVTGYKWHDRDSDGAWDGRGTADGEVGLADWTIQAMRGDTVVESTETVADGSYTLDLEPGTYTIREVPKDGWTQSAPSGSTYTVTVVSQGSTAEKNFGNYANGSVTGHKWHDLDADGTWDGKGTADAEPGLGDWTIQALQGTDVKGTTTTGPDGIYALNLAPGTYTIREVPQDGWTQSAPSGGTYTVTIASDEAVADKDFGNYTDGHVTGHKWHDQDADGTWDGKGTALAEPSLADWTIQAVQGDTVVESTETVANGSYALNLAPGTYTIREVLKDDWQQSYPLSSTYTVTVASDATTADKDFGNYTEGGVGGHKFEDVDADGTWDGKGTADAEPALNGWTVQALQGDTLMGEAVTAHDATNGDGFWYLELLPGTYTIREVPQDGWTQTAPAALTYSVTIRSQEDVADKDFGNFTTGSVTGHKWHDLDADGTWDGKGTAGAEPGLPDWTIQAVQGDTVVDSTETAADGSYQLDLAPGTYTIREVSEDGWTQSAPSGSTYTVTVGSQGSVADKDFGNYTYGTVTGFKWHDQDADGTWDGKGTADGEPGLGNWTIQALQGSTVASSTTTGADGSYALNLAPGTYTIREVLKGGWRQSAPSGGTYTVTVVSQGSTADRDFGNYTNGSVTGHKWHDLDADGTWDGKGTSTAEPGLAGWTIRATKDGVGVSSTVTGADGFYRLILQPGTYTISEIPQDGWKQSAPADHTYTVTVRSQETVADKDFGNFTEGGVGGYKWYDQDADSSWDGQGTPSGEPGLNDWTIQAWQGDQLKASTTTANDATHGDGYWYLDLDPGTYEIREVLKGDWAQSYPASGNYTVTIASQQDIADEKNFGNFQLVNISGRKFEDALGDGQDDATDNGLADWTIYLRGTTTTGTAVLTSVQTQSDGSYSFKVAPGSYTVSEATSTTLFQTYPASGTLVDESWGTSKGYTFTLRSGEDTATKDFGNASIGVSIDKQITTDPAGQWQQNLNGVLVGTNVYYRYVVGNTGDAPLHDVNVTDAVLAADLGLDPAHVFFHIDTLAHGETTTSPVAGPVVATYANGITHTNTGVVDGYMDDVVSARHYANDSDTCYYKAGFYAFTPGYWKNHTELWGGLPPYTTDTLVTAVFGGVPGRSSTYKKPFDQLTLLQALALKGGSNLDGARETLLRNGTASFLNAYFNEQRGLADYPATSAQIATDCGNALRGNDRTVMTTLSNLYGGWNNNGIEVMP